MQRALRSVYTLITNNLSLSCYINIDKFVTMEKLSELCYNDIKGANSPFIVFNEWLSEYKQYSSGPVCLALATASAYQLIRNYAQDVIDSGVALIQYKKDATVFDIFREWLSEYKKYTNGPTFMNLATSGKSGQPSCRYLVVRDIQKDGFIVATNLNSKKSQHIAENPRVGACFLWNYTKDNMNICRQVRIEGGILKLPREDCEQLYNKEPVFFKIRSIICKQGEKVEWEELKRKHDMLLQQVKNNTADLTMPDDQVAYKIVPTYFDFYYAYDNYIADRITFTEEKGTWTHQRVAA